MEYLESNAGAETIGVMEDGLMGVVEIGFDPFPVLSIDGKDLIGCRLI